MEKDVIISIKGTQKYEHNAPIVAAKTAQPTALLSDKLNTFNIK